MPGVKQNEAGLIPLHVWSWMRSTQCPQCEGVIDAAHPIGRRPGWLAPSEIDTSRSVAQREERQAFRDFIDLHSCPHRCGAQLQLILHT